MDKLFYSYKLFNDKPILTAKEVLNECDGKEQSLFTDEESSLVRLYGRNSNAITAVNLGCWALVGLSIGRSGALNKIRETVRLPDKLGSRLIVALYGATILTACAQVSKITIQTHFANDFLKETLKLNDRSTFLYKLTAEKVLNNMDEAKDYFPKDVIFDAIKSNSDSK